MTERPASAPAQSPASALVMPPPAHRAMHAPHERVPLAPGARTDGAWIWLLVIIPWALASTIYLFDIGTVLDALWLGDADAALGEVVLHTGVLVASTVVSIGCALLFAARDARGLRSAGLIRPFPWGFAAIAGLVYLIGRHVVLRSVARPSLAPLLVSIALYVVFYLVLGVWAIVTLSDALGSLGELGAPA